MVKTKKQGLKFKVIYNKKILVIIIILILLLTLIIYAVRNDDENYDFANGCKENKDCVPASCCHADSCVNIKNKPDCSNKICSMDCESILDCGVGKCGCVNNKCAVINN
ncbi:hypothetical protein J4218_02660 [Candidatus Pacearchaeota archaeon]|nr:hypothetical protein [Candidatus Pacearchaeota archaeon]